MDRTHFLLSSEWSMQFGGLRKPQLLGGLFQDEKSGVLTYRPPRKTTILAKYNDSERLTCSSPKFCASDRINDFQEIHL